MTATADARVDKGTNPILGSPNRFKIAVFSANMAGGANLTLADDVPHVDWPESVRIALAADAAGMEALIPVSRWKGMGDDHRPEGHRSFEAMTWAAGLAALTRDIAVFATVHVPTAHPVRVAKECATVDHISGGRFGLNVVAGWNEVEFRMFGIEQRGHDDRYAVADEWMTLTERIWVSDDPFDHDGRFFTARNVVSQPKPLQRPGPVVMGAGFSASGRDFAARHADVNFAVLPSVAAARDAVAGVKRHAEQRYGREILVFGAGHIVCADTEAEAQRVLDHHVHERGDWQAADTALRLLIPNSQSADFDREGMAAKAIAGFFALPLVGTPEQVVDCMATMADAGLDGLAVSWFDYEAGIAQFADVLSPLLADAGLRARTP